jgi:predicted ATPase
MITSIHLEHFKCFEDLRLPFAPLTLLTGVNAAGKSSAIQPLVLLHQTMIENTLSKSLLLNGSLLRLGRFGDVVDEVHGRDSFGIEVSAIGSSIRWVFSSDSKDVLAVQVSERVVTVGGSQLPASGLIADSFFFPHSFQHIGLSEIEFGLRNLLYLSTERIGPRETYPAEVGLTDKVELGSRCELTPWFLHLNRERQVHPSLCLNATTTLARQVEARLADFFPDAGLELKPVEGTNLVTMLIRTSLAGRFHRPQNVGFGLTNILPILAACLAASPGQPVIVENPEAHLHPAAQAKMGQFLAQVAATGVQVILESHSDHILNGIRRAVKERVLPPESVMIHYFQRQDREGAPESQVISPIINEAGIIDHWPTGFFDQFDRDLEVLTDWNKVA